MTLFIIQCFFRIFFEKVFAVLVSAYVDKRPVQVKNIILIHSRLSFLRLNFLQVEYQIMVYLLRAFYNAFFLFFEINLKLGELALVKSL